MSLRASPWGGQFDRGPVAPGCDISRNLVWFGRFNPAGDSIPVAREMAGSPTGWPYRETPGYRLLIAGRRVQGVRHDPALLTDRG